MKTGKKILLVVLVFLLAVLLVLFAFVLYRMKGKASLEDHAAALAGEQD